MSDDILSRLTDAIEAELRRQATVDEGPWVGGHLSTGLEVDGDIDLKFLARAVLTAMREPTEAVSDAIVDAGDWNRDNMRLGDMAEDIWRAGIDAALEEGRD